MMRRGDPLGIVFSALRARTPARSGRPRLGGGTEDAPVPNTGALDGRESSSLSRGTHHPASPSTTMERPAERWRRHLFRKQAALDGRRSSTLLLSACTTTPPSSSGRGHRSFTAGTRVRIPLGGRLTERGWRKSVSPGLIRQVSPAASAGPAPNAHARSRPALIRPGRGVQLPGEQHMPSWPNGYGSGLLRRRVQVRLLPGAPWATRARPRTWTPPPREESWP